MHHYFMGWSTQTRATAIISHIVVEVPFCPSAVRKNVEAGGRGTVGQIRSSGPPVGKEPMLCPGPAQEALGSRLSGGVFVEAAAIGGEHQTRQGGTEAIEKCHRLPVEVCFCPAQKFGNGGPGHQGEKEDHLSPGVGRVLHLDQGRVPCSTFTCRRRQIHVKQRRGRWSSRSPRASAR